MIRVLVAIALIGCGLPSAAAAAESVVNFEKYPDGTSISTQYRDTGGVGRGVIFGQNWQGEDTASLRPIVDDVGAGAAQSGGRVAEIPIPGGEFCAQRAWAEFESPKKYVRVYVGNYTTPAEMRLRTFDSMGNLLGEQAVTPSAAGAFRTPLEVQDPAGRIRYFVVRPTTMPDWGYISCDQARAAAIDDVTFDTPDPPGSGEPPEPPPQPDFDLAVISGLADGVATLRRSGLAVIKVRVNRVHGSKGPMTFHPELSPASASVSVSTEVDDESNPVVVTVRVKAFATAPADDYTLRVRAVPSEPGSSPGNAERSIDIPLRIIEDFDARVVGIEVTQAIQGRNGSGVNEPAFAPSTDPQQRTYGPYTGGFNSTYLAAGRKTYAFVYANLVPGSGSKASLPVLLHGSAKGKSLPGSPLVGAARTLTPGSGYVEAADRVGLGHDPYVFTLPPEWSKIRTVDLRAELLPPKIFTGSSVECSVPACATNNELTLTGVPFINTGRLRPYPIMMVENGKLGPSSTKTELALFKKTLPLRDDGLELPEGIPGCQDGLGNFVVDENGVGGEGYMGCINATGYIAAADDVKELQKNLRKKVLKMFPCSWAHRLVFNCAWDFPIGLMAGGAINGQASGELPLGSAVATVDRPFTSVAHEIGHLLGRRHASYCGGGGENKEKAELWPPDERGFIQGVGYRGGAFESVYSGGNLLYGLSHFDVSKIAIANEFFDYMSYCADDTDAWTSTRGWNKNLDFLKNYAIAAKKFAGASRGATTASAAADADARTLHVEATIDSSGATVIDGVWTVDGQPGGAGEETPYRLVVRDASGAQIAETPMFGWTVADSPYTELAAELPARSGGVAVPADIERLEVVRDGQAVAALARSANAPQVRFVRPRGGRVGTGRFTAVSWRASDADGDPLETVLDYSIDGGRSWRPLWSGPDAGGVRLASGMLGASRRARFRLRVSDGFDETVVVSRRFVAVGRRPAVSITSPMRGERLTSATRLYLSGEAWDDAPRRITGGRLAWYDGRRRIARGPQASVAGLRPGRHVIRLVARDRLGRRGSARVVVRVAGARPALIVRGAPRAVAKNARRVRLRLASTVPARLRLSGKNVIRSRHKLGRRARRVTVRVRPGTADLVVRAVLRASGRRGKATITIPRGG